MRLLLAIIDIVFGISLFCAVDWILTLRRDKRELGERCDAGDAELRKLRMELNRLKATVANCDRAWSMRPGQVLREGFQRRQQRKYR